MRFLLQHARTQLYLRSLGNWTDSRLEAYDFQHARRAIEFARAHVITGVAVVVTCGVTKREETLAIPVPWAAPKRAAA